MAIENRLFPSKNQRKSTLVLKNDAYRADFLSVAHISAGRGWKKRRVFKAVFKDLRPISDKRRPMAISEWRVIYQFEKIRKGNLPKNDQGRLGVCLRVEIFVIFGQRPIFNETSCRPLSVRMLYSDANHVSCGQSTAKSNHRRLFYVINWRNLFYFLRSFHSFVALLFSKEE